MNTLKDWKAKLESAYSFMLKYSKIPVCLGNVHFDHVKMQKADTVLSRPGIYITCKLCFYSVQKKAMLNFKKLSSLTNYVWTLEKEKNYGSFVRKNVEKKYSFFCSNDTRQGQSN